MKELLELDKNMPVVQALIFLFIAGRLDPEGPSGLEIGEALKLVPSRVSRNLQGLEAAKLIERRKDQLGSLRNKLSKAGWAYLDRITNIIC